MLEPRDSSPFEGLKLAYFGPTGAGKRSNIEQVLRALSPSDLDKLSAAPVTDSIFSVIAQSKAVNQGQYSLSSIVGEGDAAIWNNLLRGVHGVIFVADSQIGRYDENIVSMTKLIGSLSSYRIKIDHFPFVIQYNKRDLESAIPISRLEEELNPMGLPAFNAVACEGSGVVECLKAIDLLVKKSRTR